MLTFLVRLDRIKTEAVLNLLAAVVLVGKLCLVQAVLGSLEIRYHGLVNTIDPAKPSEYVPYLHQEIFEEPLPWRIGLLVIQVSAHDVLEVN